MNIQLICHLHLEVFSRLVSFRIDMTDWRLRFKKTNASVLIDFGPIQISYTNQNKLYNALKDLLLSMDQDFDSYQAKETVDTRNEMNLNIGNNLLN